MTLAELYYSYFASCCTDFCEPDQAVDLSTAHIKIEILYVEGTICIQYATLCSKIIAQTAVHDNTGFPIKDVRLLKCLKSIFILPFLSLRRLGIFFIFRNANILLETLLLSWTIDHK